jgi:hypothetical protein
MDYFQGTVETYLRADRASFYNSEFYLQRTEKYEGGKTNWFVDALNVNFRDRVVYLCEATYARNPASLRKRRCAWAENWPIVLNAVCRDTHVPNDWKVRVWIFCPEEIMGKVLDFMPQFDVPPRITPLEMTLPWKYDNHNRIGERLDLKPLSIPRPMRE